MEATLTKTTISTAILQDLVSRAAKGSTNVDIIPLSCLMQLKVKDGVLTVRTTNNVNFVTVSSNVTAGDIDIVVQTKLFTQIIGKLQKEVTSLTVDGNKIIIEADGKYNIPLALDTDGSNIQFPEIEFNPVGASRTITSAQVRSILGINKACKADMKEIPAIYNYYFDNEKVVTTNIFKGCFNTISVFETPVVLSPELVELIPTVLNGDEVITVSQDENSVEFLSSIGSVYGKKCAPADLESYPADQLVEALNVPMVNSAVINRSMLANAVDRICLFTDQLESNKLEITFSSNSIHLYSAKTDSSEDVTYLKNPENLAEPITVPVDGKMLAQVLAALDKEEVTIKFDAEVGVQFNLENLIVMLSVLQDNIQE